MWIEEEGREYIKTTRFSTLWPHHTQVPWLYAFSRTTRLSAKYSLHTYLRQNKEKHKKTKKKRLPNDFGVFLFNCFSWRCRNVSSLLRTTSFIIRWGNILCCHRRHPQKRKEGKQKKTKRLGVMGRMIIYHALWNLLKVSTNHQTVQLCTKSLYVWANGQPNQGNVYVMSLCCYVSWTYIMSKKKKKNIWINECGATYLHIFQSLHPIGWIKPCERLAIWYVHSKKRNKASKFHYF